MLHGATQFQRFVFFYVIPSLIVVVPVALLAIAFSVGFYFGKN